MNTGAIGGRARTAEGRRGRTHVGGGARRRKQADKAVIVVLIVAVSPPLIALQFDPSPIELLAALGGGVALGLVVVWYLGRLGKEFSGSSHRPGRRR